MVRSDLPGFYRLPIAERRRLMSEMAGLGQDELALLERMGALDEATADRMVENAIGVLPLPLGIATNFRINGRDYLIPMAIEEPSVIAAASNAARLAREGGGFTAKCSEPIMIGQILLEGVKDSGKAAKAILAKKKEIIKMANSFDETLVRLGGGAREIEVRRLRENMLAVHLLVDVRDAMGANAVNTMCEGVAPIIEKASGGKKTMAILSNLATSRMAEASVVYLGEVVGKEVVNGVVSAYRFAAADPYRCATHNKGIMNGIDAVAIATGNDWRAIEAGAHAYAATNGYSPLTKWEKTEEGNLRGSIRLPIAAGIVGGATRTNPIARISLKILGIKTAQELAQVMASVGLAQNFAAIRALSTEGIQKGHMKLHARNIAITAGATGGEIEAVASRMVEEGKVSVDGARGIMAKKPGRKQLGTRK
ncbi:MAG: hydroxymethylglutaryl-CoA reductase, degradative [Candidatus Micrarchaeota archaeon]|nr:hydroxymethylglutaryl-CoA reductase, degradative [Candidatus Micrarchaeota archaeon]